MFEVTKVQSLSSLLLLPFCANSFSPLLQTFDMYLHEHRIWTNLRLDFTFFFFFFVHVVFFFFFDFKIYFGVWGFYFVHPFEKTETELPTFTNDLFFLFCLFWFFLPRLILLFRRFQVGGLPPAQVWPGAPVGHQQQPSPLPSAAAAPDTVPKYGNGFVTASKKRKGKKKIKEEKKKQKRVKHFLRKKRKKSACCLVASFGRTHLLIPSRNT